jgi:adenylyltransferase/sulfurtransferase
MDESAYPLEMPVATAAALLARNDDHTILIDVREPHELEICRVAGARHVPMRQIPEQLGELPRDRHLLIMCHHGGRSRRVTEFLRAQGLAAVSNVTGGIDAWAGEIDPMLARY